MIYAPGPRRVVPATDMLPEPYFDFDAAAPVTTNTSALKRFTLAADGQSVDSYTHVHTTLGARTLTNAGTAKLKLGVGAPIGGSPVLSLTSEAGAVARLMTTQGSVIGSGYHAMVAVAQRRAALSTAIYGNLLMLGKILGGGNVFGASTLGELANTNIFGGGYGQQTPAAPLVTGAIGLAKVVNSAGTWLIVDGLPTTSVGGQIVDPTPVVWSISAGFGFDWMSATDGLCNWNFARGLIYLGEFTLRQVYGLSKKLADRYGVTTIHPHGVHCIGDSLTKGTKADDTQSVNAYPTVLGAALGAAYPGTVVVNHGQNGWFSNQMAAPPEFTRQCTNHCSPCRLGNHAIISIGTNDIKPATDRSAEFVIDQLKLMSVACFAAGMTPYFATLVSPTQQGKDISPVSEQRRQAINAWGKGPGVGEGYFRLAIDAEAPSAVQAHGDLSLDAMHSDSVHLNDTGYLAWGNIITDAMIPMLA